MQEPGATTNLSGGPVSLKLEDFPLAQGITE
jgi:hypothetical protein